MSDSKKEDTGAISIDLSDFKIDESIGGGFSQSEAAAPEGMPELPSHDSSQVSEDISRNLTQFESSALENTQNESAVASSESVNNALGDLMNAFDESPVAEVVANDAPAAADDFSGFGEKENTASKSVAEEEMDALGGFDALISSDAEVASEPAVQDDFEIAQNEMLPESSSEENQDLGSELAASLMGTPVFDVNPAESSLEGAADLSSDETIVQALKPMKKPVKEVELGSSSEVANWSAPAMSVDEPSLQMPEISSAPMSGSEEVQTLKRYASLKERELRERDSTIEALRKQLNLFHDKVNHSEVERRRLTIQLQEVETNLRSYKDKVDSNQHHLKQSENQHRQELQALQLRFDNAQFAASKSQKKLDDFRDRVRADLLKIRMREKELANRLELQKRDAEALLGAKDERLLQQKREIDRLEFELENLKERLIDETSKAEDRVARLMRALQSLKLAQGILSGMEEDVTPAARAKMASADLDDNDAKNSGGNNEAA